MIFSIVVLVLVAAIAYFHYTQGLFSATISAICAILAAVLAFSYHEVIIYALLKGRIADYAHGITLTVLFAALYLILRVTFDNLVPGNIRVPLYVDRAGAAVMGLVAGIFATGVLTTAAASLPFGPTTPYARYETENLDNIVVPTGGRDIDADIHGKLINASPGEFPAEATGMILPVDDMFLNTVQTLSTGSLAGKRPLDEVHPAYLDQLFGQRLGIQVGASRVALNLDAQQQVSLQGVYSVDTIPQADSEVPSIRHRPIENVAPERKSGGEILLIARIRFTRGSEDRADNHVRFSPASVRLVAGGQNFIPLGTVDTEGVLRLNQPDDFLILPGEHSADLVFEVPREALGLGPAPVRGRREEQNVARGPFIEVKRMATLDLSDQPIQPYPGPLEATVLRKRTMPEAKAAPRPAAPTATDAPLSFSQIDVSPALFTEINVGSPEEGAELTFGAGSATLRDGKFLKLTVNASETVQRMRMGDNTVREFFVPPGMTMVQVMCRPEGDDPWAWAGRIGQFELVDDKGSKHRPHGAWAKVKGAQGSDRMVANYDANAPVNDVDQEEGRPTDVYIAFHIPEGTQLKELTFGGKRVTTLNQQL